MQAEDDTNPSGVSSQDTVLKETLLYCHYRRCSPKMSSESQNVADKFLAGDNAADNKTAVVVLCFV